MAHKPIPTNKYIAWLKSRNIVFQRSKGSHHIYNLIDGSLERPIVIRPAEKEIPAMHIKTNLNTLGIDYKTFESEIANF